MIQSVDSLKLAREINKRAERANKVMDCLIEVNSSGEQTKYGFDFEATIEAVENIKSMDFIRLRGLMTIGPWTDDEHPIRRAFQETRNLFEISKKTTGKEFDTLSMGMSSDFEVAIEEGSNMVRVGTAIFGKRG